MYKWSLKFLRANGLLFMQRLSSSGYVFSASLAIAEPYVICISVYLEDNLRFLISKDKCLQDYTYIDVEYDANEERQLLEKVVACRFKCWKERTGYNSSEWSTRKCCGASGYFEVDVLASRVLPNFKSSTPDYLLFTKPIADAPKSVTDDIKKYVDVVYEFGFTIETFGSTRYRCDFYPTCHKISKRMKFSEEEWDEFIEESTRHVVAQLASSP
nr:transmembrane protein 194 [Tanacetum cinerariifolium]